MKRLPLRLPRLRPTRLRAAFAPLPALALAAILLPQPALAHQADQADPAGRLVVSVTDIAEPRGTLRIAVLDEAGYDGDAPVSGAEVAVNGASASAVFEGLAPGRYGVKLFHDVDDNGKMNTNPFGMPTEPYAFSNNARGRFGPATWADAAFDVGAGETVHTIRLVQE